MFAQESSAAGGFLPLLFIGLIFYLLLVLPQRRRAKRKRQQESEARAHSSQPISQATRDAQSVFLSYRRADTAMVAGRITDRLVQFLGAHAVFKDVDSIGPGEDFKARMVDAVRRSSIVLVLIGPSWLSVTDETGEPRLDDPEDPVRLEVETALRADGVAVIPILVDGAEMPTEHQLPGPLRALAHRNALPIRPDPDFGRDFAKLRHVIETRSRGGGPTSRRRQSR